LQKEDQHNLYKELKDIIPKSVISVKNKAKSWGYGYNEKYDVVVISKSGQIENIVSINGLKIALPKAPSKIHKRDSSQKNQYWERFEYSKQLKKIQSIFQWHEAPSSFKNTWVDYIEKEFDRREEGFWFYNNGIKTYITGSHYMYLQWTKIDVGYPNFREANRLF
jgi:hypothetical protein